MSGLRLPPGSLVGDPRARGNEVASPNTVRTMPVWPASVRSAATVATNWGGPLPPTLVAPPMLPPTATGPFGGSPRGGNSPSPAASIAHWEALRRTGMVTDHFMIKVSGLLDVPRKHIPGGYARYVIRVSDGYSDLAVSRLVDGSSYSPEPYETIEIPEGLPIAVLSSTSVVTLTLEFEDGDIIGQCHISRLDPRSAKPNRYAWLDSNDESVSCGVELMLEEGETGPGSPLRSGLRRPAPLLHNPISPKSPGGPRMKGTCELELTQLLDVPLRHGFPFTVRISDSRRDLATIRDVAAPGAVRTNPIAANVPLGDRGRVTLITPEPLIYLRVEYSDGQCVGVAQISRLESRSATLSRYSLSDEQHGGPANCGLELKLIEEGAGALPSGPVGLLQVKILAAHNLINKDSGLFGDYSDPFVVLSMGLQEFKTGVVRNNLNPTWSTNNEFTFQVYDENANLKLEVFDEGDVKNESLGVTTVALRMLIAGQLLRRRDKLKGGKEGQLEFDIFFKPTSGDAAAARFTGASETFGAIAAPVTAWNANRRGQSAPAFANLLPPTDLPSGTPDTQLGAGRPQFDLLNMRLDQDSRQAFETLFGEPWKGMVLPDQSGLAVVQSNDKIGIPIELQRPPEPEKYLDFYSYKPPHYEGTECWKKPPAASKIDSYLACGRDLELLVATAESWRSPVLSLQDLDSTSGPEFPDMDCSQFTKKAEKARARHSLMEGATQLRKSTGLPELPTEEWLDSKKLPPLKETVDEAPNKAASTRARVAQVPRPTVARCGDSWQVVQPQPQQHQSRGIQHREGGRNVDNNNSSNNNNNFIAAGFGGGDSGGDVGVDGGCAGAGRSNGMAPTEGPYFEQQAMRYAPLSGRPLIALPREDQNAANPSNEQRGNLLRSREDYLAWRAGVPADQIKTEALEGRPVSAASRSAPHQQQQQMQTQQQQKQQQQTKQQQQQQNQQQQEEQEEEEQEEEENAAAANEHSLLRPPDREFDSNVERGLDGRASRQPEPRLRLKPTILSEDSNPAAWKNAQTQLAHAGAKALTPDATLWGKGDFQILSEVLATEAGSRGRYWLREGEGKELRQLEKTSAMTLMAARHSQKANSTQVAFESLRGGRTAARRVAPCQDSLSVTSFVDGSSLYVVTDGFGPFGHFCAFRAAQSLPFCLREGLQKGCGRSREQILTAAAQAADADLLQNAASMGFDLSSSGATLACAWRNGSEVLVAWIGDCRALVATVSGDYVNVDLLSEPHRPDNAAELESVERQGAIVLEEEVHGCSKRRRINASGLDGPGLTITRCLGLSLGASKFHSARPTLAHMNFKDAPGLVLLASGGMCEFFDSGDQLVDALIHQGQLQRLGVGRSLSCLCARAQELWSAWEQDGGDDYSGLLLYWPEEGPAKQNNDDNNNNKNNNNINRRSESVGADGGQQQEQQQQQQQQQKQHSSGDDALEEEGFVGGAGAPRPRPDVNLDVTTGEAEGLTARSDMASTASLSPIAASPVGGGSFLPAPPAKTMRFLQADPRVAPPPPAFAREHNRPPVQSDSGPIGTMLAPNIGGVGGHVGQHGLQRPMRFLQADPRAG